MQVQVSFRKRQLVKQHVSISTVIGIFCLIGFLFVSHASASNRWRTCEVKNGDKVTRLEVGLLTYSLSIRGKQKEKKEGVGEEGEVVEAVASNEDNYEWEYLIFKWAKEDKAKQEVAGTPEPVENQPKFNKFRNMSVLLLALLNCAMLLLSLSALFLLWTSKPVTNVLSSFIFLMSASLLCFSSCIIDKFFFLDQCSDVTAPHIGYPKQDENNPPSVVKFSFDKVEAIPGTSRNTLWVGFLITLGCCLAQIFRIQHYKLSFSKKEIPAVVNLKKKFLEEASSHQDGISNVDLTTNVSEGDVAQGFNEKSDEEEEDDMSKEEVPLLGKSEGTNGKR